MSFSDMMKRWEKWVKRGMYWPFVHDPVKGKPSVTLMFFYLGFFCAFTSVCASSILMMVGGDYIKSTIMPMIVLFSTFVFYRMRRLDSVKINLQEKSLNLSSSNNEKE